MPNLYYHFKDVRYSAMTVDQYKELVMSNSSPAEFVQMYRKFIRLMNNDQVLPFDSAELLKSNLLDIVNRMSKNYSIWIFIYVKKYWRWFFIIFNSTTS